MVYVIIFLFGLLFGSFFNVCIYRIPRQESIVFPPSHCPACGAHIKPWDNIPVLSFMLLRGKCRTCQAHISWRYPLVELLTAALFVACLYLYGFEPLTVVYLVFGSALIVISFIDLDHQIIPDLISLPGLAVGVASSYFLPIAWYESLIGALVGGGVILIIGYAGSIIFKKEAMGGGDVKLMAMIGAFLGWKLALLTIFFASLVGAVVGLIAKIFTKKEYIPFGPFLSLGALLSLVFGYQLLFWYWNQVFPPFHE
jgi:leader peptidase (prepilin peptidase)/N-methyltransferase